ncbi:MAG TPA: trehalase family glycosidase [Kribbella sp.]|nr:trehalase family glycosidase [Kribbella sp.]
MTLPAEALRGAAIRTLALNWRGSSTVPSPSLYPHQWSWDSAFIAIGLSRWSQRRAETELLSLFGGQWQDGRMPHIVFDPSVQEDQYFPGPAFWRSDRVPGASPLATSGIIQPPIHARAALEVAHNAREPERALAFLRRLYPRLLQEHRYLATRRTVPDLGLAAIVHPWESGLDNSPSWDEPLANVPADPGLLLRYRRRDLQHAGSGERPTDEDYTRYIRLAAAYRDHGYADDEQSGHAEFYVVDPLFNALWAWSEEALAGIAELLGLSSEPHLAEADRIAAAMTKTLFDPDLGTFTAFDVSTGSRVPHRTVAGLVPLVVPGLEPRVVRALADQLQSPHFGLLDDGISGVPSYDLRAHDFDPRRYWRGPTWLNTTWLVWRGLRRQGLPELARPLADTMVELATEAGFREYFDPRTGLGHGTRDFSWSAALTLDVVDELATSDG